MSPLLTAFGRKSAFFKTLESALRSPVLPAEHPSRTIFAFVTCLLDWHTRRRGYLTSLADGDPQGWADFFSHPLWAPVGPLVEAAQAPGPMRAALINAAQKAHGFEMPGRRDDVPTDHLGALFENLIPASYRRPGGEHYTPDRIAAFLLNRCHWPTGTDGALLDPACGTGVFLIHGLDRLRARTPQGNTDALLDRIRGVEVNPAAALAAQVNLRFALRDLDLPADVSPVILCRDSLTLEPLLPPLNRPISLVLMNPPWVGWEYLPVAVRQSLAPLLKREGLYRLTGWRARMGGGKKDLSILFAALASGWLQPGGEFGYVLPEGFLLQEAAAGLRRKFAEGTIHLSGVDSFRGVKVFARTHQAPVLLTGFRPARDGIAGTTAIPWTVWKDAYPLVAPGPGGPPPNVLYLDPAHPEDPWRPNREPAPPGPAVPRAGESDLADAGTSAAMPIHYQAREGANTGGANGVFWVRVLDRREGGVLIRNSPESGRNPVPPWQGWVEDTYVVPLIRGRDVEAWKARPSQHMILVQNPQTRRGIGEGELERVAPRTLAYLAIFRPLLENRPLFRKFFGDTDAPWYSIYNVGTYSRTPWKVVWKEQSAVLSAAAVGPMEDGAVPLADHKLMGVSCQSGEEAYFLCALLNSGPVREVAQAVCSSTSHAARLMKHLPLPRFDADHPVHRELVEESQRRHRGEKDLYRTDAWLEGQTRRVLCFP